MLAQELEMRDHVKVARAIGIVVGERVRTPVLHPYIVPLVFESLKVSIGAGRLPEVDDALPD